MAGKHNNQIHNAHFHKDWQNRVKTWFDQPGRKKRRRTNRVRKAAVVAPRPVAGSLRPVVHCPTFKYNSKVRAGRGFTLDELKEAGINRKVAKTVGISVDHRRRNKSVEGLQMNALRLKEYKSKLIVFPRKAGKPKKGDSEASELKLASQNTAKDILPIKQIVTRNKARAVTAEEKNVSAYRTLRAARNHAKYHGIRAKRKKEREEEAAATAKKKK
eukprot:Nk52_evm13s553 gene=Nk52_evmTU13s553